MRFTVHRSRLPVDGEYDFAVVREGDNSPTLEVFGRVGPYAEGVRDARNMADKICQFLNEEYKND